MEFSAAGFSVVAFSGVDTLRDGTNMPLLGLIALGLLPLFYPLADVTHWQRLAAAEKNRDAYQGDTARWLKALRRFLRMYSIESPLLLLFVASFGAIAAGAMAVPGGTDVTQALIQALASGDNVVAMTAFSLLLIAVAAMALSTMSSGLSAGLCTIHYDILPAKAGMRPAIVTGGAFLLVIVAAFLLADAALPMGFTSSSFLALLFALGCPPLSFAPLILGSILMSRSVSPTWALRILGSGAASTAIGLTAFSVTGNDAWLWATVPACLGAGILLFAAGRWSSR
jgi:hypothetical protein